MNRGIFHSQELDFIDRLGPHLKNALKIRQKLSGLETEKNKFAASLYLSERPYILFDRNLNVTFINQQAEIFFQRTNTLSVSKGKLKASNPVIMSKIHHTLLLAMNTIECEGNTLDQVLKINREGKQDLVLQISPLSIAMEGSGIPGELLSCASIEIFDADNTQTTSEQTLEELYTFTPAEAKLAAHLLTGKSLQSIEGITKTSANTLKSHLKAIFRKTNTSRQQELIVKLSNLPRF